jgi:DtxR family Mn-dependent transcriptional regulator
MCKNKRGDELKLMQSGEDYLETVLVIQNRKGAVRSVDVAAELGVSKASVSIAMRHLEEAGYISMDGRRTIRLTEKGRRIAETVYERHLLFSDLFTALGVNRETALRDACRMEHAISEESFEALKKFLLEQEIGMESAKK